MIVEQWQDGVLVGTFDDGASPDPVVVDPLHLLAQAIVDTIDNGGTLDDLRPAAVAILTDGIS